MEETKKVVIASARCIGCGLCVKVCPLRTIEIVKGKAEVTGEACIECGHCSAACPCRLINVPGIDPEAFACKTFPMDNWWLPPGEYDVAGLVRLMASRRSCRNFREDPVDRAALEDLSRIGTTAPSGTNSQGWTFTVLPERKAVVALAGRILDFFSGINRLAGNTFLRKALKLVGRGELDDYYRDYYRSVKEAIDEWKGSGSDRLFYGAAAVIVVASKPGASCPAEDALLATQNILLAAHAMGLGTCLIGFAVAAMARDNDIQRSIGMTSRETVHAVIALGHPNETYETAAGRKPAVIRFFEG
jgi:nitroreductase/Pyruvate/2-oxoacid:ferredoxin oxidoreductase delta subunit